MSNKSNPTVDTMGIDIGKNSLRCRPRSARRDRAATKVVTPSDRSAAREHTSVPDRHGGMRWCASPKPQTSITRSRCPTDAGEIRASLFKRTEERLSRRGSNRRGGAAPDDEIRRYQDGRPARLAGAAPGARTAGQPAHRHHQSDSCLPVGARVCASCASNCLASSPPALMGCRHA